MREALTAGRIGKKLNDRDAVLDLYETINGLRQNIQLTLVPESGVKIAISDLDRFQSVNLAQDVIGQIL